MIRAKTSFVAEGVTIDRETNKVSAYGLVEYLRTEAFPLYFQKLFFFCLWERENGDPERCRAEFSMTMNGRELARQGVDIDFAQLPRNRCVVRIDDFSVGEPGTVAFQLAIPGHGSAEWWIDVRHAPPAAPGPVGASGAGVIYESQTVSLSVGSVNVHRR